MQMATRFPATTADIITSNIMLTPRNALKDTLGKTLGHPINLTGRRMDHIQLSNSATGFGVFSRSKSMVTPSPVHPVC